jgi:hypothetical protein
MQFREALPLARGEWGNRVPKPELRSEGIRPRIFRSATSSAGPLAVPASSCLSSADGAWLTVHKSEAFGRPNPQKDMHLFYIFEEDY